MTTARDGRAPPKGRPGPKPRGRTVVPLTITVTHAQRAALEQRADAEKSSISTIVRRFVAAGLAASGLVFVSTMIEITVARRARATLGGRCGRTHAHRSGNCCPNGRELGMAMSCFRGLYRTLPEESQW